MSTIEVAVYVDYSYFRKVTLSNIKDAKWVIRAVRNFFPAASFCRIPDEQWKVSIYDGQIDWKKHSEFANGGLKQLSQEIRDMQRLGLDVKLGEYALRFTVDGRPAKFKEFSKSAMFQQKGVDSLLIIDAVENALTSNIQYHVFITGDSDFKPVVDWLNARGKTTAVVYSTAAGDSREFAKHAMYARDVKYCFWPQGPIRQKA